LRPRPNKRRLVSAVLRLLLALLAPQLQRKADEVGAALAFVGLERHQGATGFAKRCMGNAELDL